MLSELAPANTSYPSIIFFINLILKPVFKVASLCFTGFPLRLKGLYGSHLSLLASSFITSFIFPSSLCLLSLLSVDTSVPGLASAWAPAFPAKLPKLANRVLLALFELGALEAIAWLQ